MSVDEAAHHVMVSQPGWDSQLGKDFVWTSPPTEVMHEALARLAADGPVIVLEDGRVTKLDTAAIKSCSVCDNNGVMLVDSMKIYGIPGEWVEDRCDQEVHRIVDAAREVAE